METKRNNLEIKVDNFGPISKADFDLRPLTVFVGPSNTGKTYLAILIYALHQYFGGGNTSYYSPYYASGRRRRFFRYRDLSHPLPRDDELTSAQRSAIEQILRTITASPQKKKVTVPSDLFNSKVKNFPMLFNGICRCYGRENLSPLFRYGEETYETRIMLKKKLQGDSKQYECEMKLQKDKIEVASSISSDFLLPVEDDEFTDITDYDLRTHSYEQYPDFLVESFIDRINSLIFPQIADPLHMPAFYLPADRTGIMHAHKVVVSSLIKQAPMAGLRPTKATPTMSGVLADFLEQLIHIDQHRMHESNRVWKDIEENILEGNVLVERDVLDYPDFAYKPSGWKSRTDKLPLMNASSMVSELAPVVLYLKYLITSNNLLIVEEPESHLHPAMQVKFARQLVALVNKGIRILVTTHSEWMLEALGNCVKHAIESNDKSQALDKHRDSCALSPEKIGIWLFETSKGREGSDVNEVEPDESGLYKSGFEEVAASLHNEWVNISKKTKE